MNISVSQLLWQSLCFVLALAAFQADLHAQTPPPPPPPPPQGQVLLIPYNDRGTWGYCDTLGNIVIKPAYREARFFFGWSIGGKIVQAGKVRTKWGDNLLTLEGALLLPKKLSHQTVLYADRKATNSFLVKKKDKYGVYDLIDGMILPAKYDSLLHRYNWTLLKRKQDAGYRRYNPVERVLEEEQYVGLDNYYHNYGNKTVAKTLDGRYFEVKNDVLMEISSEEMSTYTHESEAMVEFVDQEIEDDEYFRAVSSMNAEELGVDRVVDYRDYGNMSFSKSYGFQQTYLVEKDGKMGMLTDQKEELLPFVYDQLIFDYSGTQVTLMKDGKVGRKLVFTTHPTIEPRYDSMNEKTRLRVNPRWVFAVYEVELDGQKGYVGENGVEYFRW